MTALHIYRARVPIASAPARTHAASTLKLVCNYKTHPAYLDLGSGGTLLIGVPAMSHIVRVLAGLWFWGVLENSTGTGHVWRVVDTRWDASNTKNKRPALHWPLTVLGGQGCGGGLSGKSGHRCLWCCICRLGAAGCKPQAVLLVTAAAGNWNLV